MVKVTKRSDLRKYRIKELLDKRYTIEERKEVAARLAEKMEISQSHFRKICNYRIGSVHQAKVEHLHIIAQEFDCKIEDLFTTAE